MSIRDLPTILEALIEAAPGRKSPVALVEAARQALGHALVQLCASPGRFYLRRMLEGSWLRLSVLSPNEIPARTLVHSLGTVS